MRYIEAIMEKKQYKPVLLITVYRRYNELRLTLEQAKKFISEFKMDVVVIWAAPVIGHLWFFQQLQKEGLINHLLFRNKLEDGDGIGATTYPESCNIRQGLEFLKEHYGNNYYAIVQAADVNIKHGVYQMMDYWLHQENAKVFGFRWSNNCTLNAWNTNLFSVRLDDKKAWPPLVVKGDQDTLEHKWGKWIDENRIPIVKWVNDESKFFRHGYNISNEIELKSQFNGCGLSLYICGQHKYRLCRLLQKLKKKLFGVFSFRKSRRKNNG